MERPPQDQIVLSAILSHRKSALALSLAATAILALALSACAVFKPGSLRLSQAGGIGPVSVHLELCTRSEGENCEANKTEGQSQYMLGIAIPKGASAPQTLRAESLNSGAAIAYVRNEEVTQAINEASQKEEGQPWPPPGTDGVGYLSNVFNEEPGSVGAIATDGDAAKEAARILAAFYIPSMPPALLERHGVSPASVAPVNDAFAAGDVKRALAATPDSIADRLVVAGTPDDWAEWLTGTYAAAGLTHALVSFADPFTLRSWADVEVAGLPSLGEQVRLFGETVLPAIATA